VIIIPVMYEFFRSKANIRYCWDSRFLFALFILQSSR